MAKNYKEKGNQAFGNKNYNDAIDFYTDAISICPNGEKDCSVYYGNRAAAFTILVNFFLLL